METMVTYRSINSILNKFQGAISIHQAVLDPKRPFNFFSENIPVYNLITQKSHKAEQLFVEQTTDSTPFLFS